MTYLGLFACVDVTRVRENRRQGKRDTSANGLSFFNASADPKVRCLDFTVSTCLDGNGKRKKSHLPPWQQKIFSSMIAAMGKQLKQSVKVFHNFILYLLLPAKQQNINITNVIAFPRQIGNTDCCHWLFWVTSGGGTRYMKSQNSINNQKFLRNCHLFFTGLGMTFSTFSLIF